MRRLFTGCMVALCLAPMASQGQRYTFREYTQGLGNLNIACMAQDPTGFLWVGTQNGLYRYDGAQFRNFGPDQGLPERMIQNLYVSADGTLWVTTTTGIYFEQKNGRFAEVRPPAGTIQFLQRTGTVFASIEPDAVVTVTRDGAFLLRRSGEPQWTAGRIHLDGSNLWSVAYGPKGELWYGCDDDLCRLADGKTVHMRAKLGLPEETWTNLLVTRNGHLWLRGKSHIGEIDLATERFTGRDLSGPHTPEAYPTLAEDAQGRVLTGNDDSLALWENGRWRMVTSRNGLSAFEVQTLLVDREGSVWISEVGHGLRRWVGQDRWEGYTGDDGLSDDLIWSVMRDHRGRLWVGTENGIDWIPAGSQTPKNWHQSGVMTARTGSMAESADGAVWAGSNAGALLRIDPATQRGKQWKLPEVYDVAVDRQGHVWVATIGGLFGLDAVNYAGGPVLVEEPVFGNPHQHFSDLYLDVQGRLWAAAEGGLFVRDALGWHRIDLAGSKTIPDVIAVDHEGNVWAGGPSQDLLKLRIENYRVVQSTHIGRPPLLSEEVVSVMVDHRDWVWVGLDAGVEVFDGHTWHSYTQDDGLIWNDTDSYALAEDPDGSIWVGTSGGLSHLITPVDPQPHALQAPAFSQVTYGNSALENGMTLPWASSSLNISMALLNFKGSQNAGIRYRLVGGPSAEWETSRTLDVNYRDLGPGAYRFEVEEVDQTGAPISPVASFSFTITARWWQRGALRVGIVVFVTIVVFAMWRHRIAQLVRQKRHLESAVQQRTKDLEREKGELVRTKDQLRHFAEHDDLTGLWNHRIIVDRLRIEVDRSRREGLPLSIILVDLDFFKRINDTFGHPAGDQVLKEASATFQRMVRTYDWVGRYGGEEFLLILPGSNYVHARQRADELRVALQSARVQEGETLIPLTASFGVASGFPSSHEELIREADAALYRAKNSGRNCVVAVEVDTRRVARHAS